MLEALSEFDVCVALFCHLLMFLEVTHMFECEKLTVFVVLFLLFSLSFPHLSQGKKSPQQQISDLLEDADDGSWGIFIQGAKCPN